MRKTKRQLLYWLEPTDPSYKAARLVAPNTVDYMNTHPAELGICEAGDGLRKIRFHNTDIISFANDGALTLNTSNWHTPTTKERINRYLPAGCYLYQRDYAWYLSLPLPGGGCHDVPFADGMEISADGRLLGDNWKGMRNICAA